MILIASFRSRPSEQFDPEQEPWNAMKDHIKYVQWLG